MTNLVVGVTLTAQDGGLVGQLTMAADQLDEVKKAAQGASTAAVALKDSTSQAGAAIERTAAASTKLAASGRAAAAAAASLGSSQQTAAAALAGTAAAQNQIAQAGKSAEAAARGQRQAYLGLSQQLSDIQVQAIAGTNAFLIFGQQGGQLAASLANVGGRVGAVATFLAGPWGAALIGATTLVGLFATSLLSSGDAANRAKEAAENLKRAKEALAAAAAAAERTAYSEANAQLSLARQYARTAIEARKAAAAKVAAARDVLRADNIRSSQIGPRGELATLKTETDTRRLLALEGALRDAQGEVARTEAQARVLELPVARLRAAEATDKAVAATRRYERAEADLLKQRKAGTISQAQFEAGVIRLVQVREKEEEAARKSAKSASGDSAAKRAAAKAAREAERAQKELNDSLEQIEARFDPAASAARRYADALADIAALQRAGKITAGQALDYSLAASADAMREEERRNRERYRSILGDADPSRDYDAIVDAVNSRLDDGMQSAARTLGREGVRAADLIASAIGGRTGSALTNAVRLLDQRQGNRTGSGGGFLSTLLQGRAPTDAEKRLASNDGRTLPSQIGGFSQGFEKQINKFGRTIDKVFSSTFGENGIFGASLGSALGQAFGAASSAGGLGKSITGALGIKGSGTGAKLGAAVGSFLPIPGGDIIGSVIGSILGGALKSTPRASATITSANEKAAVAGNNAGLRQAASGLATSVQGGLQQIAEALGGDLGNFAVSIGVRDKKFRVDPTGKGVTKTKRGAVDFGDDQGGAISFAIADAIADGAIKGLTPKIAQALRSNSTNIDLALKDALKVQAIEDLLSGVDGAISKTFRDLERQIAERNRIAAKYGFDLVKLEEQNAKDRAAAFQSVIADRVGSLEALLKDLDFGNLFEGSLVDQRQKLLDEIGKAETKALAGEDGAAQQVADLRRRLLEISREAFGTAGGEFAADVSSSRSSAERIIALENERARSLADQARAQTDELKKNNELSNEANNILAEQTSILREIAERNPVQFGSSPFGGGLISFATARQVAL